MLGLGDANGRRIGDVTLISFLVLVGTVFPLIRSVTLSDNGVYRELWIRIVYIILSSLSCIILLIAVGNGATLLFHAKKSGGSLGHPNWSSSAAIVCVLSAIGLFLSTISILTLVIVYAIAKYNFFVVLTVGAMAIFTLLGTFFSAALAHSAYRDEGEDVVEFENAPDKARHYWTAEDDAEIERESGLQY